MRRRLTATIAVLATLAACASTTTAPPTSNALPTDTTPLAPQSATAYPDGLTDHTIVVGGVTRTYRVHVPTGLTDPTAIVVVLHGGGGGGSSVADNASHPLSTYRTVADAEGFIAVYPEGLPDTGAQGNPSWTDCRSDNQVASGADDVGFLATLIGEVRGRYGLGTDRVFMTGSSNGAQMTQAFAFNRPDLVAAVAAYAGGQPLNPRPGACTAGPAQSVPILIGHGTVDPQMPYEGGCVADIGGSCNRGRVISAEATRDRWLAINGVASVSPVQTTFNTNLTDAGPADRFVYAGDTPVTWWRFEGGGHMAPSLTVTVSSSPINGVQNRDVEFAELVWDFFAAQLPVVAPAAPANLAPTPGVGEVVLTWDAPTDNGGADIVDYVVEYSTDGTIWTTFPDGPGTTTSVTVTGLTADTTYVFRVSASNASGTGTHVATLDPVAPLAAIVAPGKPGVPLVEAGVGTLTVTVTPPSTGSPADSYAVTAVSTTLAPGIRSCTVPGASGSCTITDLSETGSYRVTVLATNTAGDSPVSEPAPTAPRSVTPGAGSPDPSIDDVPTGAFFTRATSLLRDRGITTGLKGTNNFNPTGPVTRAEMATFLWRMAGIPASPTECGYSDTAAVPAFAREAVCWVLIQGITTNNPYNPGGTVNRAQMAAFIYRTGAEVGLWLRVDD